MGRREAFGRACDQSLASLHRLLHHRAHVLQGQVRPPRSHQPRILPDRQIIRAAITGIAGGQVKNNITAIGGCG